MALEGKLLDIYSMYYRRFHDKFEGDYGNGQLALVFTPPLAVIGRKAKKE